MEFVLIGLIHYMLYRIGKVNYQHQNRLQGYQSKPSNDPVKLLPSRVPTIYALT